MAVVLLWQSPFIPSGRFQTLHQAGRPPLGTSWDLIPEDYLEIWKDSPEIRKKTTKIKP
jgi:hypothetical protein